MRLPLLPVLLLLLFNGLIDWHIICAVNSRCKLHRAFWHRVAKYSSIALAVLLVAVLLIPKRGVGDNTLTGVMVVLYTYISIYAGKFVYVIFDLVGSIPRLFHRPRLLWPGRIGIFAGLFVTGLMVWGATVNRFNVQVKQVDIIRADVPPAFDGLKIVQISDIHTGSYMGNTGHLQKIVRTINSLEPDMVLFTGDIVNRHSSELQPYMATLSGLQAPLGVYSVTGNHDYGDYHNWATPQDKADDVRHLWHLQRQMGWTMLNDSSVTLRAGNDSMVVMGVQNISEPPFITYGNLAKAYPGNLADSTFKVLMSHNPMHWNMDISNNPHNNIALTLSGHTHAMQIELGGKSPAALRYPTWGGLYADSDSTHLLYVNIGTGTVGIPARIGATPEITLFTLHRK